MMRKASPETDQIIRSFLQKTIRRGDEQLAKKAIAYILKINEFQWMRKRLAVMTFEECWPYGLKVEFDNDQNVIIKHYLELSKTVKNKNAAGLGSLAYALSQGDESVYQKDSGDKAIKIIAEGIKRSKDFWIWAHKQNLSTKQRTLVENADKGFRKSGWPWDRAFAQAAAYLAITDKIPEINYLNSAHSPTFPLWVGIDKHTKEGKIAIREAAKQTGINANKALWLAFYFESAKCNELEDSPWWTREIKWRMAKLEFDFDQGKKIWDKLRPKVKELLHEEVKKLEGKLDSGNSIDRFISKPSQTSMF